MVSAVSAISDADRIRAILARVPDPEIPAVSVVDLGIVREIAADTVTITPTYTGCPATMAIERSIREALDTNGFANVAIETTLSPPWSTDWISDEGREKLRAYGIAPPRCASRRDGESVIQFAPRSRAAGAGQSGASGQFDEDDAVPCPQCGSTHTTETSHFGSTACKALYRCLDCLEPFDHFKRI